MLKRIAIRFLLFGLGFALSYALTRPEKPTAGQRIFVCEYRDAEHRIVIAENPAACAERHSPQIRTSHSSSMIPASSRELRIDNFNEAVPHKWQDRSF